jgi:hypothetical protein
VARAPRRAHCNNIRGRVGHMWPSNSGAGNPTPHQGSDDQAYPR